MEKIIRLFRQFWALDAEEKVEYFRRYQKYLYLLVVALVAIQLLLSQLLPRWLEFSRSRKDLGVYQKMLLEKQKSVLNKDNVEKELAKLKDSLTSQEAQLFTEDEFNEFAIHTVSKIAQGQGCKVSAIMYRPTQELGPLETAYPLKLRVEGSYQTLVAFCSELEHYEKVIKLTQFSISKKTVRPLILIAELDIQGYGASADHALH